MANSTPLQGKTRALAKRTPAANGGRGKDKPNGNIMSFFKKANNSSATAAEEKEEDEQLFLDDSPMKFDAKLPLQTPTPPREETSIETWPRDIELELDSVDSPLYRYNENLLPSKRRRTDETPGQLPSAEPTTLASTRGPFADDSDSDDEQVTPPNFVAHEAVDHEEDRKLAVREITGDTERQASEKDMTDAAAPSLKREATSIGDVNEFDGIEDFIDDEFPEEGEEYLERRWMEEQAEFEAGLEGDGQTMDNDTVDTESKSLSHTTELEPPGAEGSSCPICGGNTAGLTEQVWEYPNVEAELTI